MEPQPADGYQPLHERVRAWTTDPIGADATAPQRIDESASPEPSLEHEPEAPSHWGSGYPTEPPRDEISPAPPEPVEATDTPDSLNPAASNVDPNAATGAEKKPSIWKRELTFGRPSGTLSYPAPPVSSVESVPPVFEAEAETPRALFDPAPRWEGEPAELPQPHSVSPIILFPADDQRPGWSDAEPVWERAEPELETVEGRPEPGSWPVVEPQPADGYQPLHERVRAWTTDPIGADPTAPQRIDESASVEPSLEHEPEAPSHWGSGYPTEPPRDEISPVPAEPPDDTDALVSPNSAVSNDVALPLELPGVVPVVFGAPWVPHVTETAGPERQPEAKQPERAITPKPKQSLLKRDLHLPRRGRRKSAPASIASASPSISKNLVGLRIGSSQLAAACVHNNGSAELVQFARAPLERGIVAGGEVRDPEALTRALKAFFAHNKLPRRGIRLGIASNRIGVRLLEVPAIDDRKLFENSIRFHAQETLPIAVSEAIIDHIVLGPGSGVGLEPTVRVLLVFAHRELVDRHVEACRRAGLKLEGIDFEAFALLRSLATPRPSDVQPENAVIAVAVGNERTIFAVSDGRICDFTRVLEWGGGSLDVAIARALDLTPSQAEPIKLALALDGDVAPSQLSADQVAGTRAAIRAEIQSLGRELVSSLQFYQAREGSLDIGEILLSGGGAQLAGFAEELERLVGVPVRRGDPFSRVLVGKKVSQPAETGSLAVAIGLGIED